MQTSTLPQLEKGWLTDRGRIYILLGEPASIDSHPFEVDQSAYEVWYYDFKGLTLTFTDTKGFGDYELQTPYWDPKNIF